MIDAKRGMAIEDGVAGGVVVTADGSRTWTRTAFPADVVPSQFYENVAGHAWAYSRDGRRIRLYRSADAGLSWAAATAMDGGSESTDPLFIDSTHGWLGIRDPEGAAAKGDLAVARSVDGGATWALVSRLSPTGPNCVYTIAFRDASTGFAGGGSDCAGAELLVTHDGGAHWAPQSLPMMTPAPALGARYTTHPPLFTDRSHGSLVVSAGVLAAIYLTGNGGTTWVPHPLPATPLQTDFIHAPQFWMVAGRGGATAGQQVGFYDSPDGGLTWHEVAPTIGFEAHGIQFEGIDHGWALASLPGQAGATLMFTSDGGVTWSDLHPSLPSPTAP